MFWRPFAILGFSILPAVANATEDMRNRWTLSTKAGSATLAFVAEPGTPPPIMFVCGSKLPGVAQIILASDTSELGNRRLRIEIAAGAATAMAAGERSTGMVSATETVLGEITTDRIQDLMQSRSMYLTWRIETDSGLRTQKYEAIMPHPLSRQRVEFLRFCA